MYADKEHIFELQSRKPVLVQKRNRNDTAQHVNQVVNAFEEGLVMDTVWQGARKPKLAPRCQYCLAGCSRAMTQ
ncbi:unnamed protein product [Linum trigynum]|uniref:Uncharacterized protein n=1 Tax=Linum trigynum TaxID=586398 RepID=A0AAV2FD22_9ROSI